jgi:hypothetical protein
MCLMEVDGRAACLVPSAATLATVNPTQRTAMRTFRRAVFQLRLPLISMMEGMRLHRPPFRAQFKAIREWTASGYLSLDFNV